MKTFISSDSPKKSSRHQPSCEENKSTFSGIMTDLSARINPALKNGYQAVIFFYFTKPGDLVSKYRDSLPSLIVSIIFRGLIRSYHRCEKIILDVRRKEFDIMDLVAILAIKGNGVLLLERNRRDRNVIRLEDFRLN